MKILESIQNGFSNVHTKLQENPRSVATAAAFTALAVFFAAIGAILVAPIVKVIVPAVVIGVPVATGLYLFAMNRWESSFTVQDWRNDQKK